MALLVLLAAAAGAGIVAAHLRAGFGRHRDGATGRGGLGLRGSLRNSKDQLLSPLGDVIVAVDGQGVRNSFDVTRLVAAKRPGETVTLTLWRDRQQVKVPVTLLKRTVE